MEFAKYIQNTNNYYVLVTREGLSTLPYSTEEIYGIRSSEKYGGLTQTYHELYRIYKSDRTSTNDITKVVTEDSNSGFQFFEYVCKNNGIGCVSASGKSNICREIIDTKIEKTENTYLQYNKKKLNPAYLKGDMPDKILKVMENLI